MKNLNDRIKKRIDRLSLDLRKIESEIRWIEKDEIHSFPFRSHSIDKIPGLKIKRRIVKGKINELGRLLF